MSVSKLTARQWFGVFAGILLIATLTVGGIQLWQRFDQMQKQTVDLSQKATRAAEDAQTAAQRATQATALAEEASTRAGNAEAAREAALSEKTQAEQAKLQAETTATEATKKAQTAQSEVERMQHERDAELDRMQQLLNRLVETRRTSSGLVMNLSDKALHFEFDSATLSAQSRELLSRIAGILLASGGYGLAVHGHTDDVGTTAYNQGLSERRAQTVKQYLASAGIEQGIIATKGYGKSSPLANGQDEAARARNRRVEIVLTDTKIKYVGETR